jgi:NAD(P)-dependent dehydrogenase (short-subunit alcohol dehydrogenase family)
LCPSAIAPKSWRRVLDVNLTGVFLCVSRSAPYAKAEEGVLLATASMAGLISSPAGIEYNVSKTA